MIYDMMRGVRFGVVIGAFAVTALSGCATGSIEDPSDNSSTSCSGDVDCADGLRCDVVSGQCVAASSNGMMTNNTSPNGASPNGASPNSTSPGNSTTMNSSSVNNTSPSNTSQNNTAMNNSSANNTAMNNTVSNNTASNNTSANNTNANNTSMNNSTGNHTTPDPCEDVVCSDRAAECDGDFVLEYGTGACNGGTCQYSEMRTDCTAMGKVCQGGACADPVCDPPCEAGGVCTPGGCTYGSCVTEGQMCDASMTDQGDFLCLVDQRGSARCYTKCTESYAPAECADAQRCLPGVQSNPSLLFCVDSGCSTNAECNGGTCLRFENNYGVCEPGGAVAKGGVCNTATDTWCQQGLVCNTPNGSTTGVCEQLCDPWAASTGCAANEHCSVYTSRSGVCTTELDSTGTQPFEQCSTPGAYCDDATFCAGNGSNNICYKFCRPGASDCNALASTSACNDYVFAGDRSIGICDVDCSLNTSVCGAGGDCVNKVCRRRCTAMNVVADCGSASWQCVNGYCE